MRIRYHAAARELAGVTEEDIALEFSLNGAELRAKLATLHPALAPYLPRMRFAADGVLGVEDDITPDAVVDVLPPVAGGSDLHVLVDIREAPLSVDECLKAVTHSGSGGVALFLGVVRDHADGQPVARLEYEAHLELALPEAKRVVHQVATEVSGVRLAMVHRTGALAVGDVAVIVAASAAHREEAFRACRLTIDRIKETVPIWKKEWSPDGLAHWVNLESPPD